MKLGKLLSGVTKLGGAVVCGAGAGLTILAQILPHGNFSVGGVAVAGGLGVASLTCLKSAGRDFVDVVKNNSEDR